MLKNYYWLIFLFKQIYSPNYSNKQIKIFLKKLKQKTKGNQFLNTG